MASTPAWCARRSCDDLAEVACQLVEERIAEGDTRLETSAALIAR
jgi:hypothetical protein